MIGFQELFTHYLIVGDWWDLLLGIHFDLHWLFFHSVYLLMRINQKQWIKLIFLIRLLKL
jgi:hypothetical protein